MAMTNCSLLKEKIVESGISITFLAEKCNISRDYFYKKLNGEVDFKQSEIVAIQDVLHLSQSERNNIFFAKKVDQQSS